MAIWDRKYTDDRTYFNTETGLIEKQNSELTIRVFGVPMLRKRLKFNADILENERSKLGFNNK